MSRYDRNASACIRQNIELSDRVCQSQDVMNVYPAMSTQKSLKKINFAFFSIFGGVLRTTAKNKKNMLDVNLAFCSMFGSVLRTAAKNRKKCLMKTLHFWRRAAHRRQKSKKKLENKVSQNFFRQHYSNGGVLEKSAAKKICWSAIFSQLFRRF